MQEIIKAIIKATKKIDFYIKDSDYSKSTNQNSSGDTQLKLDVIADEILENEFKKVGSIKSIISEEKDKEVEINKNGVFLVGYDPLDGSSIVDVNLSVGSIFGIYQNNYNGASLIGAVYVVFGPRIEIVIAQDDLKLYRLIDNDLKFISTISLNTKGKINASGGTQKEWFNHHKKLINDIFNEGYRLRYSGGMVPDLHAILLKKGGLFSYPATHDKPNGKLRMIFEVFPFAFIYEMAGGEAIDSKGNRLLELKPKKLHDSTECFFGSKYEIAKVKEAYGV